MASNFQNTSEKAGTVTLNVYLIAETASSLMCGPDEDYDDDEKFFLPNSQITVHSPLTKKTFISVTMPLWLAKNEGLA